jgi:N utilization substance protein B
MASNRHLCRIIALQSLYEYDFRSSLKLEELKTDMNEILDRNIEVYKDAVDEADFIKDLALGTQKHQKEVDALIVPAAPEWPLDQIAKIDKAILRMSLYELMIKREVPPKVAINEAVELAKEFGGENSSKFVNGVLGTIYRGSEYYDESEDKRANQAPEEKDPPKEDQEKSEK